MERLVDGAVAGGAHLALGGRRLDGPGYFFSPTVLTDVPPGSDILDEEIFGPVASVVAFDTEDEAVRLANATPFGLVCFVYTRDLDRGLRMSERLETGMLGLNTGVVSNPAAPFGGVKQSGLGREGGAKESRSTSRRATSASPTPSQHSDEGRSAAAPSLPGACDDREHERAGFAVNFPARRCAESWADAAHLRGGGRHPPCREICRFVSAPRRPP